MAKKKDTEAEVNTKTGTADGAQADTDKTECDVKTEKSAKQEKPKKAKNDEAAELRAEIEKLRASAEKEHESLLRISAEYDNYRRRTTAEKQKTYNDAVAETAEKFLAVMDSIDRALAAPHAEDDGVYQGLCMIAKQFSDSLAALGVTEIPTDTAFDPNLHNAVMHIDDEEKGEGEITDVFGKGFRLGDRVLRHSIVKVAN